MNQEKNNKTNFFIKIIVIIILYFILTKIGISFIDKENVIPFIWPISGLSLALIVLYNVSILPLVIFSSLLSTIFLFHSNNIVSFGFIISEFLSMTTAYFLLKHFKFDKEFSKVKDVTNFYIFGAFFPSALSFIPLGICLLISKSDVNIFISFMDWWFGNTLGIIVITPLLLLFSTKSKYDKNFSWNRNNIFLLLGIIFLPVITLYDLPGEYPIEIILLYFSFPLINIMGIKNGLRASVFTMFLFSCVISFQYFFNKHALGQLDSRMQLILLFSLILANSFASMLSSVAIIERRRVEGDLKLAIENADHANLAKSNFLATMGHEIRTPLNIVIGMSDILVSSILSPDQKYYANMINKSSSILYDLINDILDLSKIEAGKLDLRNEPFHLYSLLKDTFEIMAVSAKDKGLQFIVEMDFSNQLIVEGDKTRLRQIIVNLIGNAIKFTQEGSITITFSHFNNIFDFQISDTGIGISKKNLSTIFEKFTQIDSNVSRKYKGSGLGLTITRALINLMGGDINVESQEGQGTTFNFYIPLKLTNSSEKETHLKSISSENFNQNLKILVVDDSEDNRILINVYLKNIIKNLDFAVSGIEAINMAIKNRYDIILMDVQMPEMDGHTATMKIREWELSTNTNPTAILALSAHALSEEGKKSIAAGCNAHLTKPIKKNDLLDAIRKFTS